MEYTNIEALIPLKNQQGQRDLKTELEKKRGECARSDGSNAQGFKLVRKLL